MKDRPIAELLSLAKAGDPAAVAEVESRYEPLLHALSRGCPPEEIEDVMQEGRLGVLVAIERFDPTRGVSFGTFAQAVCRHRIATYLKNTRHDVSAEEWAVDGLADSTPGPEDVWLSKETLAETKRLAKEVLSDKEYKIWRLRVDGYGYDEIRTLLALDNDKTINNALQRARRKLIRTAYER